MYNHRIYVNPERVYCARIHIDYSKEYPDIYTLDSLPANVYLFIDYHSIYLHDIGYPLKQIIHSSTLDVYKQRLEQSLNTYNNCISNTLIYNVRLCQHGEVNGYPLLYTTREIKIGESLHVPKGLLYWIVELFIHSSMDQLKVAYHIITKTLKVDCPIFEEYLRSVDYYIQNPNSLSLKKVFNSQQFI